MRTKTKLRTWRVFSPLLITLLLIGPLVSSAEFAGNFVVTNNGNALIPAGTTQQLIMQFDLPAPAVDSYALNGASFAVSDGDILTTLVGGNLKFGDEAHSNNNNAYTGNQIIVDSADTYVTSAEVVTPGLAALRAGWATGQNIQYGDEDHDDGADYDGNNVHEIIVNSADNNISAAEIVTPGVADLNAFPSYLWYLETAPGTSIYGDGKDIVMLTHAGATATSDGDAVNQFNTTDYYSDADGSLVYTDGEAIVSSGDANLDNGDTIVTPGTLDGVSSTFCGAAPTGTCSYYDPAPAGIPYCVVDDTGVVGTIEAGDILISNTCGTGHSDNYTFLAGDAEVTASAVTTAIPANDRFVDDNTNNEHDSTELVWQDDGDATLEAGELLFGFSTTALTSLSGSTALFFNDNAAVNGVYDDGEDIYTMYYTGSVNDLINGQVFRSFDAAEKFSDNNNDGLFNASAMTGPSELIANSADNILAGGEIITPGFVDVTSMTVNGQQVYSDADGSGLYTDGELIADSANTVLTGAEIRLDGQIDLIGFGLGFTYHDGSTDGNYTDGEDIISDVDGTGYYNADRLTSLKIGNPGTCLDSALGAIDIWEDTDGSNTLAAPDNNLGGIVGVAPYFGRDFPTSGSIYTAGSNERTIFVTIDSAALDGSTHCTVTPIIPNTGGVPYAAQFLSGDNGPTDGNVATTDVTTIDLIAPTPNVANIDTYVVEHAGSATVANEGDDVVVVWDSSSYGDVVSVSADFSDFGGGVVGMEDDGAGGTCDDTAAGDDIWCATVLIAAGAIDDTDNDVTLTLATDAAGNVAGDVTDDIQFSVDNQAPTVTLGNIKVLNGSGPGGAFLSTDTPVPSWDNRVTGDNNPDIASVTFDASDFRPADGTLVGINGGAYAVDFWSASLTGAMPAVESINNNISVTVVDDGGNSVSLTGTNNYTIDTVVPTPNPLNITTTITENAGNGSIVNPTDVVNVVWDAASNGYTDVLTVYADFSDFGGANVAMRDDGAGCDTTINDDIWCATYTVVPGTIDDADNDVTITLATDVLGNIAADVDDNVQFSVDNEAPSGAISVTGASGTAGAFKLSDIPIPTWVTANTDIVSVNFTGTDFRGTEPIMPGVNAAGTWTGTFTGPIDSQDDTNNNVSITATDDAGNVTAAAGTNNYDVDNELPSFTAVQAAEALMQTGAAPTLSTQLWYYYTGQNLRMQINNATETDGNDLAIVKACMRSMIEDTPAQTCSTADFNDPTKFQAMTLTGPGNDSWTMNYALAGLPGGWPTAVDGYQMNFQLEDDAGNVWQSANAAEFYIAVFNVIPQNIVPALNNATTTDWSTITDFTNVPAGTIVFNAQDAGFVDIARMTFNAAMDLTNQATVTGLQALAANVTTTDSVLRLDSSALAAFDIATQLMVKPAGGLQPEFTVKDDAGAVLGTIPSTAGVLDSYNFAGHGTADNFVWAAGPGTLTFDVSGFSSYESDVTAPTATIVPANASSGVAVGTNIVVTFDEAINTGTFTYTLAPNPGGLSVVWSGGNTVATISHTAFANSTSYTFSITGADDLSGNAIAPTASTFSTVAPPSSGGGGGSAAFGAAACSGAECTGTTTTTTGDLTDENTNPSEGSSDTTPSGEFSDVVNHWAASYIETAKTLGYIDGYADNTFKPDQNINRAEAAKLIAMWMMPDLESCTESAFTDVACTEWFGKYVMYLKLMAVIEGYPDNTFRAENSITRAEALKMMLYAKGLSALDVTGVENTFSDISANDWFYAVVLKGYSMGIISGYPDGTFGPNQPITRAEFTKIFVNTFLTA